MSELDDESMTILGVRRSDLLAEFRALSVEMYFSLDPSLELLMPNSLAEVDLFNFYVL